MGSAVVFLVQAVAQLLIFAIFAQFIVSLLIAFDIINTRNQFVWRLSAFLDAVVNPLLRPLRRFIPILGGVDITPIVLLLLVQAVMIAFNRVVAPLLIGALG